ncbi:PREDICTED: telomerase reverse transcriptase-like, partial [Gekko japonicus]|uniref:Telomerase reverse transcriptase n=1 Tax=Gekko japonicus TaxID=146911 RepID=A0ABM1KX39_GEKJA
MAENRDASSPIVTESLSLFPSSFFLQISSPREVVERVIQRICEQGKKNVLAFGYSLLDEGRCPLPGVPTICSILPNNTTEDICQSVLWEKFLSRVGDELMMYLLEHCALFMLVSPTCCYQICGRPVYQLTVGTTEPSPVFFRQTDSRPTHNVLSRYLLGRLQSRRRYLGKAKWRKRQAEIRDPQGGWCSSLVGRDCTKSKPVTRISDYLGSQRRPSQRSSLTAVLLKRKRKNCSEMDAKRMKTAPVDEGLEEQARDLSLAECKDQLIGGGGSNLSGGSVRACSEDKLAAMKCVPQERGSGAQTSGASFMTLGTHQLVVCDRALRADGEKKTFQNSSINTKRGTGARRVSPVQKVTARNITADKCRKNTLNSVREPFEKIHTAGKIKMRDLLYSRRPWKERLPHSFVLNRLKGCQAGGRRLVEAIFLSDKVPKEPDDAGLPSCRQRKKRLPKRYRRVRGEFQELLRNHAKCPYLAMLKKHCPVLVSDKIGVRKLGEGLAKTQWGAAEDGLSGVSGGLCPSPETSNNSGRIGERVKLSQKESEESTPRDPPGTDFLALLKQNSSPWQVYTFVRGCLERVVPAALWGSSHNKRRFYKNVKKFISLGKLDTFPLRELLWRMRVNDCAWLRLTKERGRSVPASEHQFRTRLLFKFLFWLMDSYVAQLLWSFFYITEAEFQKNLLFFFRKAVWRELQSLAVRSHLAKVRLLALSKEEIETLQQRRSVPLAAKLRFIPKKNGLRPVVRLDSPVGAEKFCKKNRDKKVQYFNMQLKNLYSVLKYEQKKNPGLLGSSVFGKDDIYATWKKFVLKVLESNAQMPAFYFVKADVSGAYDTIPHRKVVEVIARILGPDNKTSYCIRRYAVIIRAKNGQIIKRYRRHVSTLKDFIPDMALFVRHLQQTTSLRNAVVVEQGVYLKERCSDLFGFFLQLIHSNILKIENRYYVQCCGIPQGSILSTFLCSLCYGDMEKKLLHGVQEDGLLMRLTDDFLLVTPHLAEAKTFL